MVIRKKEHKLEYWPRLQKVKQKSTFIRTDFSKWVDEDEQDGEKPLADDLDMEGMGGMGGMGGDMDIQKVGHSPGLRCFLSSHPLLQLMAQIGEGGGAGPSGSSGPEAEDSDSEDEGPPPLE